MPMATPQLHPRGLIGRRYITRDPKDPNYKAQQPGLNPELEVNSNPSTRDDISTMEVGTVQITPEKQQLIGVKYEQVQVGGGSRTIRAVGKVAIDETRIGHVHTKVEGWIDKVFVDFTGKLVEKGQPLLTIYSPDMFGVPAGVAFLARLGEEAGNRDRE